MKQLLLIILLTSLSFCKIYTIPVGGSIDISSNQWKNGSLLISYNGMIEPYTFIISEINKSHTSINIMYYPKYCKNIKLYGRNFKVLKFDAYSIKIEEVE